jgi:hypothetical protein
VSILVLVCVAWLVVTEVQTFLGVEVMNELSIDDGLEASRVR